MKDLGNNAFWRAAVERRQSKALDSWWDDGSPSEAAYYFRDRINLDDENECNGCNAEKFKALRLLLKVRGMYWEQTKAEVLELAYQEVRENPDDWPPAH